MFSMHSRFAQTQWFAKTKNSRVKAVCNIFDQFQSVWLFKMEFNPLPDLLNTWFTIVEIDLFYGGKHLRAKTCRFLTYFDTLQDGDIWSVLNRGWLWKHSKYWLTSSNVLIKHWTYFPKAMLIYSNWTRCLIHFFYDFISAFDKLQRMLRYLLLKIIFLALIFKSSIFNLSSCTTFCDF